jgi:hypothetical protein
MDTQRQYGQHELMSVYSPTTPVTQGTTTSPLINASLRESWHPTQQSPSNNPTTPSQPSQMYPLNRSQDHMGFASLPANFMPHHPANSFRSSEPRQPSHHDSLNHDISPNVTQGGTSIGPSRILTRRQRALQRQNGHQVSAQSPQSTEAMDVNSVRSPY